MQSIILQRLIHKGRILISKRLIEPCACESLRAMTLFEAIYQDSVAQIMDKGIHSIEFPMNSSIQALWNLPQSINTSLHVHQ